MSARGRVACHALGMRIGVLGATGPAGRGLAARLTDAGHEVLVGSRDAARARDIVGELRERWGDRLDGLAGVENRDAAAKGELVVVAVPWRAAVPVASDLASELSGKVVVSMANALERREDGGFEAVIPESGSVAAGVAAAVPDARVVATLHHVAAHRLESLDERVEGDVLLCSDDREAAEQTADLVARIPDLAPVDAGSLYNAVGMEAFTAVMLSVNVRHKARTGLRLTGLRP